MPKPTAPAPQISETKFADHTVIVPPNRLKSAVTRSGDSMEIAADPIARAETALKQIKKELRRNGATDRAHQKAIEILEAGDRSCRDWAARTGLAFPEVNWDTLDNRRRRSKKPRKKKRA